MQQSTQLTTDIVIIVTQMIRAHRATRAEYQRLFELIMADGTIDEVERQQINRLFDAIQTGRVKIID